MFYQSFIYVLLLLLHSTLFSPSIFAQSDESSFSSSANDWEGFVRFREGHQFLMHLGSSYQNVVIDPKDSGLLDPNTTSQNEWTGIGAGWSFYLPIYGSFGYSLGSDVFYSLPTKNTDQWRVEYITRLPGVSMTLFWQQSPRMRFGMSIASYLERERVRIAPMNSEDGAILETMQVVLPDLGVFLDHFIDLKLGIRLQATHRKRNLVQPNWAIAPAEKLSVSSSGLLFTFSLLYHLV